MRLACASKAAMDAWGTADEGRIAAATSRRSCMLVLNGESTSSDVVLLVVKKDAPTFAVWRRGGGLRVLTAGAWGTRQGAAWALAGPGFFFAFAAAWIAASSASAAAFSSSCCTVKRGPPAAVRGWAKRGETRDPPPPHAPRQSALPWAPPLRGRRPLRSPGS